MLKAHIIKKIHIDPQQRRNLAFLNAAVWLKAKDSSISKTVLFINILTNEKATKLKVDQDTLSGANDLLLNGQINLDGYRGIEAITLELQTTCADFKVDSSHLEIDFIRKIKKAA